MAAPARRQQQCLFSSARAVTSLKLDSRRARLVASLSSSCTNDFLEMQPRPYKSLRSGAHFVTKHHTSPITSPPQMPMPQYRSIASAGLSIAVVSPLRLSRLSQQKHTHPGGEDCLRASFMHSSTGLPGTRPSPQSYLQISGSL